MHGSRYAVALAVFLGGVVLGAQLLRAQSASPLTLSGTLREGQPGQTPYQVIVPEAWKGTLVLDLDFVTSWQPAQRQWFLDRGYAIGGITRANNEASYAMRDYVDNLLTLRRLLTEQRSAPTRTLAMGVSRGAYVALAAIDAEPDVFAGAVALSGGSLGLVARMLSKLDRTWALKSLVDPASSLTLVNLPKLPARTVPPTPYVEDTALTALVEKARSTPIGRARLMLAAAFDQVPRWGTRNTPAPAADNLDGQLDQVVDNFGGGFNQSLRWAVETAAGGNTSWNHGVDYADLLARSGLADLVAHAYRKAGGDLQADLATLAKAPRVAADPAALARAERGLLSYSGKIKGPVIIGTTVGDPAEAPSIESAYVDTVKRAGGNDLVRTIFSARPGHASWSVLEKVTAFQALVERLDAGQWGTIAQVPDMSARASRLKMASQVDLGTDLFVDVRPAPALRTWDATNWGSYRQPGVTPQLPSTSARTGTWELDLQKSTFNPGPGPRQQTRVDRQTATGIEATVTGTSGTGTPINYRYSPQFGGGDVPTVGTGVPSGADSIAVKVVNERTIESTLKRAGMVVLTRTEVVSADGRMLTITSRGLDVSGVDASNVTVYNRR